MATPSAGDGTAGSRPTAGEQRWRAAAAELAPQRSLARAAANARFLVGAVTVVGAIATGLGAAVVPSVSGHPVRTLALTASLLLSAASVAMALYASVGTTKTLRPGNLDEVRTWYKNELDRTAWAGRAGLALTAAVVLAAVTAASTALAETFAGDPKADLALEVSEGKEPAATGTVRVSGTEPGTPVSAVLDCGTAGTARTAASTDEEGNAVLQPSLTLETAAPNCRLTATVLGRARELVLP